MKEQNHLSSESTEERDYPEEVSYFEALGIVYIEDNTLFTGLIKNIIYFSFYTGKELSRVPHVLPPFPFTSPYAVIDNHTDLASELFNKRKKDYEIVSYDSIKRRGWQIVKRPIISSNTFGKSHGFMYYLRNTRDQQEPIGSITNEQPQNVLIQIDNITQSIRLIGKEVNTHGKTVSSWRKLVK